jgi:transglutaminase-like putative cysteine protease
LASDTVRVRRVTDLAADYALPASAARGGANLTPTLLIESADPRVRAVAVQETGGTPDPARAAELLAKAVHDRTTRRPEQGPPNARHTLESRRGDVNHLAELYVALARSIGLPARTASGLLYVNGRFYVHAWAEVLLKDWVPVDPALGQFPADAAHIRLATDRLARPMELTPQLGGVTITVLGTESER